MAAPKWREFTLLVLPVARRKTAIIICFSAIVLTATIARAITLHGSSKRCKNTASQAPFKYAAVAEADSVLAVRVALAVFTAEDVEIGKMDVAEADFDAAEAIMVAEAEAITVAEAISVAEAETTTGTTTITSTRGLVSAECVSISLMADATVAAIADSATIIMANNNASSSNNTTKAISTKE